MMAFHELGHVLHALASGGRIAAVHIPLIGFSLTELTSNPHPHFVAWGGPVWGSMVPVLAWRVPAVARSCGRPVAQFFAGFCLVANGVYLGAGWTQLAGDAADLVRYGTPVWVLMLFGMCATGGGLYLWHLLGNRPSPQPSPPSTARLRSPQAGERA